MSLDDAVGRETIDQKVQFLHLTGLDVMEGDGIVADAVFTLQTQKKKIKKIKSRHYLRQVIQSNSVYSILQKC